MDYITAEQFLQQPEKVQKVLLQWFCENGQGTDLIGYIGDTPAYEKRQPWLAKNVALDCLPIGIETMPLFTETQLRHFIEEKTGCRFDILRFPQNIWLRSFVNMTNGELHGELQVHLNETDLLQAYWKVACEIAKEGCSNQNG